MTSGLPLLSAVEGAPSDLREVEDCGSERDSGTGDSKRSYDNNETNGNIVDHVIHNFLSARGDIVTDWRQMTSLSSSDLDTGVSSMGDQPAALHRPNCPKLKATSPNVEMPPITLAVDNPLYDSLPASQSQQIEEADSSISHPPSEVGGQSTISPPASVISDSVAYCGRFPPPSISQCPRCGEDKEACPHTTGDVSSVSSYGGQSSAPSQTVSDNQPITFNTFHPFHR